MKQEIFSTLVDHVSVSHFKPLEPDLNFFPKIKKKTTDTMACMDFQPKIQPKILVLGKYKKTIYFLHTVAVFEDE